MPCGGQMKKDFLCMEGVSADTLTRLMDDAVEMKKQVLSDNKVSDLLKGKTVATLFYENSTRTRCSFEDACKYLGATVTVVDVSTSSVQKGESILDTARTIEAMGTDAIVIRHSSSGAPKYVADNANCSVINAGDGLHAHPTQALLDLFTIREKFGRVEGLTITIIGDVKHSRVARSNIVSLTTMGAKVRIYGPPTMIPLEAEKLGCEVCSSIEDAFKGSDVIMGLRIQLERQKKGLFPSYGEYARFFGINPERMKLANKGAIAMHPGPVNRGVEFSYPLCEDECCYKDIQVTNGVATRMALLKWVLEG